VPQVKDLFLAMITDTQIAINIRPVGGQERNFFKKRHKVFDWISIT
jgi:hypothetical protein